MTEPSPEAPSLEVLEHRRRTGLDRYDEVWNGEWVLAPLPAPEHGRVVAGLMGWLLTRWLPRPGCEVLPGTNITPPGTEDWTQNYRGPDVMLMTPKSSSIEHEAHLEGSPEVVVEVRSPRERTYQKLEFYAETGAREIWVIDSRSRAVELFAVDDDQDVVLQTPDHDGWLRSRVGVELRPRDGKVEIRLAGEDDTTGRVP